MIGTPRVQWWCSATGAPWDWSWRAYPGVWLLAAVVAAWLWHARHGPARSGVASARPTRWRSAAAWLGVALLWLTLDWPIGPLGAGYLASVHAMQFLALAMFIPPLLLVGVHPDRPLGLGQRVASIHPLVPMLLFTIVMLVTHLPRVVDGFMSSQLGAFALDASWLVAGLAFWWPLVIRRSGGVRFPAPMRMLYLFFGTQVHLYIAMWLLLAEFPVYATYELAPRVTGLSALQDQQVAGGLMLGLGGPFVLAAITVLFFRWANQEPDMAVPG